VTQKVREKILQIFKTHLAQSGVAFLSFNTYPGWFLRGMIRDLVRYHARGESDPLAKVAEGRKFIGFLARNAWPEKNPHVPLLRHESKLLESIADSYICHEHFEPENRPFYFEQFIGIARSSGLRSVSSAFIDYLDSELPAEVKRVLEPLKVDRIRYEQCIDFLMNRAFRCVLLCHEEREIV
jgi:hypothetical protein